MARSLNRVQLIGNLTRDPELRYTPAGTAVCSFSIATNRSWTTDSGEKKDEADFHRIVAWNKLAELCSQFLAKGRKVYVEGRLSTRNWTGQDGSQRSTTEVIISDMILLDSSARTVKTEEEPEGVEETLEKMEEVESSEARSDSAREDKPKKEKETEKPKKHKTQKVKDEESSHSASEDEVAPDDIPF
jgi:single-strand DNA-binding protein